MTAPEDTCGGCLNPSDACDCASTGTAAPPATCLGADVSVAQGLIVWREVAKATDRVFFWAKATEGAGYVDPQFANNAKGCRSIGRAFGGYEFAHLDTDPEKCAEHTCAVILANGFCDDDLPPMLDVERLKGSPSGAKVIDWILAWGRKCESLTGRRPTVYTGAGYWSHPSVGNPDSAELGRLYRLHLAAYVTHPDRFVPRPWAKVGWTLWQESGDQAPPGKPLLRIPGIGGGHVNVDSNVLRGTVEWLIADSFVQSRPTDPAPPPSHVDPFDAGTDADAWRPQSADTALANLYALDSSEPDTAPQTPASKISQRLAAVRPDNDPEPGAA